MGVITNANVDFSTLKTREDSKFRLFINDEDVHYWVEEGYTTFTDPTRGVYIFVTCHWNRPVSEIMLISGEDRIAITDDNIFLLNCNIGFNFVINNLLIT